MFDLIIVGAGPAGMMAAITAGRLGHKVLLCERQSQAGQKVLASGGGRCNLTNTLDAQALSARYHDAADFVAATLHDHDPDWLRAFFSAVGLQTHAPDGFHVFPLRHRASDVHAALLAALEQAHVELRYECRVQEIVVKAGRCQGLRVDGQILAARRVVLACGGRGYPGLGGHDSGLQLAASTGHKLIRSLPAMVPLVTRESWPGRCTSVTAGGARLRLIQQAGRHRIEASGDIIFTRTGLAGPLIQDISREVSAQLVNGPVRLRLNLSKNTNEEHWAKELRQRSTTRPDETVHRTLCSMCQRPLAQVIAGQAGVDDRVKMSQLRKKQRRQLAQKLAWLELNVVETEGWPHAMVMRGGVSLQQVDKIDLESRLCPGLFFAGEMLDVDGPCGGFNLQWAFASGARAGKGRFY